MIESSTSRTMAFGVGGLAIVFLVAVLTWTVAHQFEFQREADYAWVPDTGPVVAVTWPLALGLIVGGFGAMRRAPSLGALLVVVASAAFAATIFWAVVPPLVAIAVSFYAVTRARRLQQRG